MANEELERQIDARMRVITIVWGAIFMSIVLLLGFALFVLPRPEESAGAQMLAYFLYGFSAILIIVSILMKQRNFAQARDAQSLERVHSGMIVAFALSEASALFGLFVYLTTTDAYWFLCFGLAVVGMIYHFPRREQFIDAAFKLKF